MKRLAFRCPLEAERFRLNEQIVNTRETGRSPKKKKKTVQALADASGVDGSRDEPRHCSRLGERAVHQIMSR